MRSMMQEIQSISTEPQFRNMQVPLTTINVGNEEVHQLLRPIQSVDLDINKLSATVLVESQHVSALGLVDQQKELTKGYVQSQSAVEKLQKEVEELHQVKVQLPEEKVQEIDALKVVQAELQCKVAEEIT